MDLVYIKGKTHSKLYSNNPTRCSCKPFGVTSTNPRGTSYISKWTCHNVEEDENFGQPLITSIVQPILRAMIKSIIPKIFCSEHGGFIVII